MMSLHTATLFLVLAERVTRRSGHDIDHYPTQNNYYNLFSIQGCTQSLSPRRSKIRR